MDYKAELRRRNLRELGTAGCNCRVSESAQSARQETGGLV